MEYKSLKNRISAAFLSFVLLAGFTGNEKYLELSGYLNARSSAKFRSQDQNILGVLDKGTRGEILDRKLMRSGNYGFKVEVLEGPMKGRKVWVYYNKSNPDLALYDVRPQDWEDIYRLPTTEEFAVGVETVRETPALQDPDEAAAEATAPTEMEEAQGALQAVVEEATQNSSGLLTSMRPRPKGSNDAGCPSCVEEARAIVPTTISRATRATRISDSCDALMTNRGEVGAHGRALQREMTKSSNAEVFLRNNAMGALCPNFRNLSRAQKTNAWLWFWTVLADEESSCNPQVLHPTHANGRRINNYEGWGYWAMERHPANRLTRGDSCQGSMTSVDLQVTCSVSIMKKHTLKNPINSLTNGASNYWGPLNRYQRQLLPKMKRFTACF